MLIYKRIQDLQLIQMSVRYISGEELREKTVNAKVKIRFNYYEMAKMLSKGYAAFAEGMTPQQAWYARRRLKKILGVDVIAIPYEEEGGGSEGYIIMALLDTNDEDKLHAAQPRSGDNNIQNNTENK